MKKLLLLIFSFSFAVFFAHDATAQFDPQVSYSGPNTAGLLRFDTYQVNLFTGLPDISIPLYEVESGPLKVPIVLQYHASGIKVSDVASWAGLGWTLSAGGMINRRVYGDKPDEMDGYLNGNYINGVRESYDESVAVDREDLQHFSSGGYDLEPDMFSFSFPGRSGRFFFNRLDSFKIEQIPYSPLKIKYSFPQGINLDFKITDEFGNDFEFGKTAEEGGQNGISSWMLESLVSQNRQDTILLSYDDVDVYVTDYAPSVTGITDRVEGNYFGANDPVGAFHEGQTTYASSEEELTFIYFKQGRVKFNLGDNRTDMISSKNLASIEIQAFDLISHTFVTNKKITFHQSYFESNRLRLDSLSIYDRAEVLIEKYRFEYNTDINLPEATSFARDTWGYYNGQTGNTSLLKKREIDFQNFAAGPGDPLPVYEIGTAIRDTDKNYVQANILKTIHYPTGGHTNFEYESNRIVMPYHDQDTIWVGGVRVKSIESFDDNFNVPLKKTYEYGPGIQNYSLNEFDFYSEQYYDHQAGHDDIWGKKRVRNFYANPNIDINPYDGALVVYPFVTEYIGTKLLNKGKTVYEYTWAGDEYFMVVSSKPIIQSSFYLRGKLKAKTEYANIGTNEYIPRRKDEYTYAAFPEKVYNLAGFVAKPQNLYTGALVENWTGAYQFGWYKLQSGDTYLIHEKEMLFDEFDSTKFVKKEVDYVYQNKEHQQVNKIITTDSQGRTVITTKKYPSDYRSTDGSKRTHQVTLDHMLTRNIQAALVEQWQSLYDTTGHVTGAVLNSYGGNLADENLIELISTRNLQVAKAVNDFQPASISGGQLQSDSRYQVLATHTYDHTGHIVNTLQSNGIKTGYQWAYQSSYPMVKAVNAVNNAYTTHVMTQSTARTGTSISYPTHDDPGTPNPYVSTPLSSSVTFTSEYEGQIVLEFYITDNSAGSTNVSYFGSSGLGGGSFSSLSSSPQTVTLNNVGADVTYTIEFIFSSSDPYATASMNVDYPKLNASSVQNGFSEFYFESFEETNLTGAYQAHTGERCSTGDFNVTYELPNARQYKISYWYFSDGTWHFMSKPYTAPTLLTEGDAIDDIRIHPTDAQLTTYTYKPHIGMTSVSDANSIPTYYEYDNYQRLQIVRDADGNIVKMNTYNYKVR